MWSENYFKPFFPGLIYNYGYKLFSGCGGPISAFKKGKSSEFDFQDTGESPKDPLLQRAAHVRLDFLQRNMNIQGVPEWLSKVIFG